MQTQWSEWLAAEKGAGRGGIVYPEPIVRNLPFTMVLPIPMDVSADAFTASIKQSPDAGTSIDDFTVTVGSYASGVTNVTLALDGTTVFPTDADGNGLQEVVFDLLYTPSGRDPSRAMAMVLLVSGQVTEVV